MRKRSPNACSGKSTHNVGNPTEERIAIKIKTSDNGLYRVSPVFAFIESGTAIPIEITRTSGPAKEDRLVVRLMHLLLCSNVLHCRRCSMHPPWTMSPIRRKRFNLAERTPSCRFNSSPPELMRIYRTSPRCDPFPPDFRIVMLRPPASACVVANVMRTRGDVRTHYDSPLSPPSFAVMEAFILSERPGINARW